MSFLDDINNSIATNEDKAKIVAELNSFIEGTKRLWIEATYASLKDAVLEKAKRLSSSSFDGIFTVYSMSRHLPFDLEKKIREYGLENLFDNRFKSYLKPVHFILGDVEAHSFTVEVAHSYEKKRLFFKKKITYITNELKFETTLESTFKDALQEVISLAENDGIKIDTSSIFIGKNISNYYESSAGTVLFLNGIHSPSILESTRNRDSKYRYFLRDCDSSNVETIDNMQEFCNNQRLYTTANVRLYDCPAALQELSNKSSMAKHKNINFDAITLQLKYSIRG